MAVDRLMDTVKASSTWGKDADVFRVFVEPAPQSFMPDPVEGAPMAAVLLELDENERETGRIAGFEIVGFLGFGKWETVPELGLLWELPDSAPLPLVELLKRKQRELRKRNRAGAA